MDNRVIQSFKNEIGVEKVLKSLSLDYDIKNEDAVLVCPFHKENTPSFRINLESGLYHCFGCDISGGDIIHFIMEYKQLGFVQSLELLSELTGISLPSDVEEIDKNDLIHRKLVHMKQDYLAEALNIDFTSIYKTLLDLCSKKKAIDYLKSRNINNPELIVEKIGVRVLDNYDKINNLILERFTHTKLMQAGIMNDKKNLIFYNHRLLLPFYNNDEIVYLSARTLDKEIKPKYLNLAHITIPNFYNVNDIFENDTIFIAEGQTDTLSLVGINLPVVGIAGATNIDIKTLELLNDKNIIVAFDNDSAGEKGKEKLLEILKYIAKSVRIYEKIEKDINEHLQSNENIKKITDFYNETRTCNLNR